MTAEVIPVEVPADPTPRQLDPFDRAMAMVEGYIARGGTPAEGKDLFDLVNAIRRERAEIAYNTAMVACQAEMTPVASDGWNPHTKSGFPKMESIQKTCKPVWLKNGFALSFTEAPEQDGDMILMRCDVQHIGGFVKTHYGRYPRDGKGAQGGSVMNALQGTVSAHSYAERDMTTLIFNIVVEGRDKDGNSPSTMIGPNQIKIINTLIDFVREDGGKHDHKKFLEVFGIKDLGEMPVACFTPAVKLLNSKLPEDKQHELPTGNPKGGAF